MVHSSGMFQWGYAYVCSEEEDMVIDVYVLVDERCSGSGLLLEGGRKAAGGFLAGSVVGTGSEPSLALARPAGTERWKGPAQSAWRPI